MEKNWLIRTKNNHILGPVSKEKVKELISNGSIKGDDEICSGNGYWLFVKEKELIEKYIFGESSQPFNPVSEAESVLTKKNDSEKNKEVLIPSDENLEYPDNDSSASSEPDDITLVGGINIKDLDNSAHDEALKFDEENDNTDEFNFEQTLVESQAESQTEITNFHRELTLTEMRPPKKKVKSRKRVPHQIERKSKLSDKTLYTLVILFFIAALALFYYRKRIIKEFIETSSINWLIPAAHAQIKDGISIKKKV